MAYTDKMLRDNALQDKVIVVTGGGSGLGKSMTKYFMELGARVAITSRDLDKLKTTAAELEQETGGKFYFGIDFHSTWDDIYYPMDKKFNETNMPNLVWNWLENIKKSIPNYEPNIQANARLEPTSVSRNYFLKAHNMEAIVFEIGDNTPRDFIKKKGEVGAVELMKLMMAKEK